MWENTNKQMLKRLINMTDDIRKMRTELARRLDAELASNQRNATEVQAIKAAVKHSGTFVEIAWSLRMLVQDMRELSKASRDAPFSEKVRKDLTETVKRVQDEARQMVHTIESLRTKLFRSRSSNATKRQAGVRIDIEHHRRRGESA